MVYINGLMELMLWLIFCRKTFYYENYSKYFFISTLIYTYGIEQGLNRDFNISGGSFLRNYIFVLKFAHIHSCSYAWYCQKRKMFLDRHVHTHKIM